MTKVELVARALAASRTGRTDEWSECCADALLVLAACDASATRPPDIASDHAVQQIANDR
ncbi:hypothetical protein [Sphingomonas sp. MS122]|uniref:hypothetical protein n=1 Tax=Sphingomonas sp. MS122 TaxID=3412683 RepID=UPI003C2EB8D4